MAAFVVKKRKNIQRKKAKTGLSRDRARSQESIKYPNVSINQPESKTQFQYADSEVQSQARQVRPGPVSEQVSCKVKGTIRQGGESCRPAYRGNRWNWLGLIRVETQMERRGKSEQIKQTLSITLPNLRPNTDSQAALFRCKFLTETYGSCALTWSFLLLVQSSSNVLERWGQFLYFCFQFDIKEHLNFSFTWKMGGFTHEVHLCCVSDPEI